MSRSNKEATVTVVHLKKITGNAIFPKLQFSFAFTLWKKRISVTSWSSEFSKIVLGTNVFFEGGIFFAYKAVSKTPSLALFSVFS